MTTPLLPGSASQDFMPSNSAPNADGAPVERGPSNDARELAIWRRLRLRFFTQAGNKLAVAVVAGAANAAVTWARAEQDARYLVTATPDWSTTVYVTAKTTTGCTVNFGTVAPGGGGHVDLITARSED